MIQISTVAGAAYQDDSGERIGKILDAAGVPSSLTNIQPGISLLDDDPGTERTAQAAIQQCESSEAGAFFITADGVATFYDRHTIQHMAAFTRNLLLSEAALWIDAGEGEVGYEVLALDDLPGVTARINYTDISQTFDDQMVYNDITVEDSSGTGYQATDSASINEYFRRTYTRSSTLIITGEEAEQHANYLLAAWKQPQLIIGDIMLDGRQVPTTFLQAVLSTDLMQPVSVVKHYTSSTAPIERLLTLQGVSHTISPSRWSTSLSAAEPITDLMPLVLGSLLNGVLGTNKLGF
jgi:hypothetical protein